MLCLHLDERTARLSAQRLQRRGVTQPPAQQNRKTEDGLKVILVLFTSDTSVFTSYVSAAGFYTYKANVLANLSLPALMGSRDSSEDFIPTISGFMVLHRVNNWQDKWTFILFHPFILSVETLTGNTSTTRVQVISGGAKTIHPMWLLPTFF